LYDTNRHDALGRKCKRLDLLIFGALAWLGRGLCVDDQSQMSNISEETHRKFNVETFLPGVLSWYDTHVRLPANQAEFDEVESVYAGVGLPGCGGSIDCVHVYWYRCPATQQTNHRGKEGYPTRSYEVIVDHSLRIRNVSGGFPGTNNDKSIVRNDIGVEMFTHNDKSKEKHFLKTVRFKVGNLWMTGSYLICDGGYHLWDSLMCPYHLSDISSERYWSRMVEAVRKDVERTFGILKVRFMILKHGFKVESAKLCDQIFIVCCILHNMLIDKGILDKKGNDTEVFDDGVEPGDIPVRVVIAGGSRNNVLVGSKDVVEKEEELDTNINFGRRRRALSDYYAANRQSLATQFKRNNNKKKN
jgi:hypothetical protein